MNRKLIVGIDARLVGGSNTGDSTYWTCLIQALGEFADDVELILYSNAPAPNSVPLPSNSTWVELKAQSSRWWSLVVFPMAVRKECDLGHTQYSVSPLLKRAVTTIHDVSFLIGPQWFSRLDRLILSRTVAAACRYAKQILTVSETSRTEIESLIPISTGKVRVTPNACPPWIRHSSAEFVASKKRELGLPDRYLLTVGTEWARKNMELAVAAAREYGELPLVITGKPRAKDSETMPGTEPGVIRTGYVDRETLCALYTGATLYLAPSFHEGFGIPLLEAFECGTPVLCGPGGAMPEVAAGAAFVASDYQVSTWTEAIREILNSPTAVEDKISLGRARLISYTWSETARLTVAAYQEACKS